MNREELKFRVKKIADTGLSGSVLELLIIGIAEEYAMGQNLQQTDCYKLRELLVQKVNDVEEIIKDIDKEDGSLIDTWHNYQQGLKYALSLIDTVSP